MTHRFFLRIVFFLAVPVLLFWKCQPKDHPGRAVAQTYCGSCHLMPEPELLPRATWDQHILPIMSGYLGIIAGQQLLIPTVSPQDRMRIAQSGIFPESPVLTDAQWELIRSFYLDNAPDSLLIPPHPAWNLTLAQKFQLTPVVLPDSEDVTLLDCDPLTGDLWYGTRDGNVASLNKKMEVTAHYTFKSTPSDVAFSEGHILVTTMGIMNPADSYLGKVMDISRAGKGAVPGIFVEGINRPVEIVAANLVGDEKPEWIVCEYGNFLGSLLWYETTADGLAGNPHVLRGVSGARAVIPTDFDADGKTDFIALFAQGNESVVLYKNKGEGHFEEKSLLRFPPVFGSGYIELTDMNGDTFPDIVYTNGDNGDHSQVLKPYHGVRIYLNDGQWNFSEKWFYPQNGASKTVTRDFDGDGDLDIASISFFPDSRKRPEEGFIFFENTGNMTFNALADRATAGGRWMVMTAADRNGDGVDDIVLGSALRVPKMGFVQQPDLAPLQMLVISKK